jgi:hypothetical protein
MLYAAWRDWNAQDGPSSSRMSSATAIRYNPGLVLLAVVVAVVAASTSGDLFV